MEQHYSVRTVAERLDVPFKTVQAWLLEGRLHGIKVGKKWKIPESAIDEFIATSTAAPAPRVGAKPAPDPLSEALQESD